MLSSSIRLINWWEKSSKLIFSFSNEDFPWPKISYDRVLWFLKKSNWGCQISWVKPTPWTNTIGVCSFLLKEKHNYQNIGIYSLLIPVGIINGIKQTTNIPLTIKWPNDLFYRDKKVGGILIESKKIDQSIYLNIGFGINVNSSICDFPKGILNNLNSLKNIYKSEVQREPLLANILNSIEKLLNNKKNIVKHWMNSCNHINKKVNIIRKNKPTQAIFKTVNNRGQAIVNYQGKDIVINEPFF